MSNKFLPVFVSNARYGAQKLLPRLLQGGFSPQELLTFCHNHRLMGLGTLLLLCDTEQCQSHLYRSGRAFLELGAVADGKWAVALSRATPFFDALAAFDIEGARELAIRAPHSRRVDSEYEEDFLYVRFLMDHCLLDQPVHEAGLALARFEKVLQGSKEPRLDVSRALLTRNEERFHEALQQLVSAQRKRHVLLRERGRLSQELWATEAKVCVEGLALCILAEHLGLRAPDAQPGLPSVARFRQRPSVPSESWKLDA
ncbi:Imm49 family immunity protein [Myxococcus sp. CA040A]|uniref:Imm49 family immunity protein n=1 Tax=Myxococcus sp. CA040A TaxID=2741738 RepID=UPI00157BB012|nr:Imm49 family immunity protein [Myxococcus sp. CA040A]NTX02419.1 immunity 49 family protein [Myxococcus sp. CA040A]